MAHIPQYNPKGDIIALIIRVEELERKVEKIYRIVTYPTILEGEDGDINVTYELDNAKESNIVHPRNGQESVGEKPQRRVVKKTGDNKQNTKPGKKTG